MNSLGKINPKLLKTKSILSFIAVEPSFGDWAMVSLICLCAIPLAWYTTKHLHYAIASCLFYWLLAYTLIDDKFETVIDQGRWCVGSE
jgi:hypothetical protein